MGQCDALGLHVAERRLIISVLIWSLLLGYIMTHKPDVQNPVIRVEDGQCAICLFIAFACVGASMLCTWLLHLFR